MPNSFVVEDFITPEEAVTRLKELREYQEKLDKAIREQGSKEITNTMDAVTNVAKQILKEKMSKFFLDSMLEYAESGGQKGWFSMDTPEQLKSLQEYHFDFGKGGVGTFLENAMFTSALSRVAFPGADVPFMESFVGKQLSQYKPYFEAGLEIKSRMGATEKHPGLELSVGSITFTGKHEAYSKEAIDVAKYKIAQKMANLLLIKTKRKEPELGAKKRGRAEPFIFERADLYSKLKDEFFNTFMKNLDFLTIRAEVKSDGNGEDIVYRTTLSISLNFYHMLRGVKELAVQVERIYTYHQNLWNEDKSTIYEFFSWLKKERNS